MRAWLCKITAHVQGKASDYGTSPEEWQKFEVDAVAFLMESLKRGGFVSGDRLHREVTPLTCMDGVIQVRVELEPAP